MPGEIGGTRQQEEEANDFAMALLMPRQMLEHHYKLFRSETDDPTVLVNRMASRFNVEPRTMHARLLNLGYLMG